MITAPADRLMFRFKQFTIQQDRTAMKVCTDACVLGAYADVGTGTVRVLDIGTGTGLLALMAAQRNPSAQVDAIELDESAYSQAVDNVVHSPFPDRVRVHLGPVQHFSAPALVLRKESQRAVYNRILTNPPFYTNSLRSPDASVNRALHSDDLPTGDLVAVIKRLLASDGQWWVLLPPYESARLNEQAQLIGLHVFRRLLLRHNASKPVFRHITGFKYDVSETTEEILDIYELDGKTYTERFRTLLQSFYLIF